MVPMDDNRLATAEGLKLDRWAMEPRRFRTAFLRKGASTFFWGAKERLTKPYRSS